MKVDVVYASKTRQHLIQLELPEGSTVQNVIDASNILTEFPEIDLHQNAVGIFGKKTTLSTQLTNGDRIEIYRPLALDPMQKRRNLARLTEKKRKT